MKSKSFSIENMSIELKVAYILIILLIITFTTYCFKKCSKKTENKDTEIKAWIQNNPEAILESVNNYVKKEQEEAQRKQREASTENLKKYNDRIKDTKNTGVINAKGSKIIVEFFDYNCGYCKMAAKSINDVTKKDKDVKVIFRELPIFGGMSEVAAQYAVAVSIATPNKYFDFHENLFEIGARTKDNIIEALKKSKIDVNLIERTLKNKKSDIEARIQENKEIASLLGLQGTPAFVIGDEFIPGYVDEATILNILSK